MEGKRSTRRVSEYSRAFFLALAEIFISFSRGNTHTHAASYCYLSLFLLIVEEAKTKK